MDQIRIIPEPHIRDKNFQTRVDYLVEIESYMNKIKEDVENWKQISNPEDNLHLMFIGDVFDNSMSELQVFIKWIKFFTELNELVNGNLYSVVGNHEITYKYYNPFWMMADVKSDWVLNSHILNNNVQPVMPIIKIMDELRINNTLFVFGHYNRKLSNITDEWVDKNYPGVDSVIVLSHNEIVNPTIRNFFKETTGMDVTQGRTSYADFVKLGLIPPTTYLKDVFIGHMHMAYGDIDLKNKFRLCKVVEANDLGMHYRLLEDKEVPGIGEVAEEHACDVSLHYLASIGRTNVNEIKNNFTKRRIPVITLDGNNFEIGYYNFNLVGEVAIDREEYVKRREQYNSKAEIRALRDTTISLTDPTEDLKAVLSYNVILRDFYVCAIKGIMPSQVENALQYADAVLTKVGYK